MCHLNNVQPGNRIATRGNRWDLKKKKREGQEALRKTFSENDSPVEIHASAIPGTGEVQGGILRKEKQQHKGWEHPLVYQLS